MTSQIHPAALLFWGVCYQGFGLLLAGGNPLASLPAILGQVLAGNTRYHLWFLYVILGLYLVTPFLRKLTENGNGG